MARLSLDDLYALIPPFQCRTGCTDCCRAFGIPSRTPEEDARIKSYLKRQGRQPAKAQGTTCPYVTETGCSIYPVRPLTCRLYGTSTTYRCQRGVVPLEPLHEDLETEIMQLYRENFFSQSLNS